MVTTRFKHVKLFIITILLFSIQIPSTLGVFLEDVYPRGLINGKIVKVGFTEGSITVRNIDIKIVITELDLSKGVWQGYLIIEMWEYNLFDMSNISYSYMVENISGSINGSYDLTGESESGLSISWDSLLPPEVIDIFRLIGLNIYFSPGIITVNGDSGVGYIYIIL